MTLEQYMNRLGRADPVLHAQMDHILRTDPATRERWTRLLEGVWEAEIAVDWEGPPIEVMFPAAASNGDPFQSEEEINRYVCPWCGLRDSSVEVILIHKLGCPSRPERLS